MKSFDKVENKMKLLDEQQAIDPPAYVWDNIEAELDGDKKKRILPFLFFGLSILLGLIVVFRCCNFLSGHVTDTTSESNTLELYSRELSIDDKINEVKSAKSVVYSDNAISEYTKDKNDVLLSKNSTKVVSKTIVSTADSSANRNYNNAAGSNTLAEGNVQESTIDDTQFNPLINNFKTSLTPNLNLTKGESFFEKEVRDISTDAVGTYKFSKSKGSVMNQNMQVNDDNMSVPNQLPLTKLISLAEIRQSLITLEFERKPFSLTNRKFVSVNSVNRRRSFSFDLNWSYGFHSSNFLDGDGNAIPLRNNTEVQNNSFGFKVGGHYQFDNNIVFSLGLDYLKIKDSLDFTFEKFIRNLPPSEPGLDSIPVFENQRLLSTNNFTFIDIPIAIGYEFSTHGFRITPSAGLILNLSSRGLGRFVRRIFNQQEFDEYTTDGFENYLGTKINLGMMTSVKIAKPISSSFGVFIRPSFKRYIGDLATTNMFSNDIGLTLMF